MTHEKFLSFTDSFANSWRCWFWGYQKLTEFVHTPVNVKQDQLLTIERGTTGSKLAALLEQEKFLNMPIYCLGY